MQVWRDTESRLRVPMRIQSELDVMRKGLSLSHLCSSLH